MNCIHLAIFRKVFCWKTNNVIMYCLLFVLLAHHSSCQHRRIHRGRGNEAEPLKYSDKAHLIFSPYQE